MGAYRYGFNGKENDNEVKGEGNQQDYGMRIYDTRIGRFLSVDPLVKDYPMLTPYQFASNTPMVAIDLDGGEAKIVTIYHSQRDNKEIFRTVDDDKSILGQLFNTTTTIHKYPYHTENGVQWQQFGFPVVTPNNFKNATGILDLGNASIVFGKKVTSEFRTKTHQVANNLGMDVNNLMTIMAFETGGSFSPSQKNGAGSSGTGLIQFMSFTAKKLGTTVDALSKMTAVDQLSYVEKYFNSYKGKLKTLEDAYMAVLWPKAVGESLDFVLWDKFKKNQKGEFILDDKGNKIPTLEYKQNSGLDTNADEQITKKEVSAIIRERYAAGEKTKN